MHFVLAFILLAQPGAHKALFDALKAGRYTQAVSLAGPLIEADPRNSRLWTARGLAYKGLGRSTEAVADFEKALSESPEYLPALEGAAETAYSAHDPRTERFLGTLLKLQPGNQTAHAMSGVLGFEAKDCAGAVSHFERARNAIARNEVALSQFGICLLSAGRAREATEAFGSALALNPSNAATRFNLGLAQSIAGQSAAAILTLEPLTGHHEFDSDVLNLLAAAYAAEDRIQEAMSALRRAAEIAPKDERNYLDLAVICMEHQAPKLALEMATVGLKNIPDSARLYATRGAIYATMSRTEDAEADFEAAERLMPDALYGSVGLSLLFRYTNQFDRSIAILRERLQHAPDDPTLNFLLADALLRSEAQIDSQELKEARAALLRSVRAKPDFAKAHAELGKIYLKDGETEKAMNELRLALRQDPQDHVALHQLSIALQRQGRTEEARAVATKLRNLLRRDQEEEKQRNRFELVKAPPSR